jgi:hypothetical protein
MPGRGYAKTVHWVVSPGRAASVYHGGSAEPIAYLACEKNRNAHHLADLADAERMLRHR